MMKRRFYMTEIVPLTILRVPRRSIVFLQAIKDHYAAADDGIYKVNFRKQVGIHAVGMFLGLGIFFGGALGIGFLYFGFQQLLDLANSSLSAVIISVISAVIFILIGIGILYGIYRLVKYLWKISNKGNYIDGELVIPWSYVNKIIVSNVRQETYAYGGLLLPSSAVTYTIGDWLITTKDGKNIYIYNVVEPYTKLDEVRQRFNLHF